MVRRLVVVLVTVAAIGLGSGAGAGASVAATEQPCKVLKRSEISDVLGQPAGKAKKGRVGETLTTCRWDVDPAGELPEGEIHTLIQSIGAKTTYDVNRKAPTAEPIPGVSKAYYDSALDTVNVLRGDLFLNVQAVFIATDGGFEQVSRKDELIELLKKAVKRLG